VTLSYVDPQALYSVIAQAGVTGRCRVTDMLPIFTDPDEQKIGVVVETISGKNAVVGDACSNRIHFGL
jgi:hypothetical protein